MDPRALMNLVMSVLPRPEQQRVPVANALEFQRFRELYGRDPRMGELATEEVAPASYLAGQVGGTNVAGGAPGPRFGAIYAEQRLMPAIERALDLLPYRVRDYLLRTKTPVYVRSNTGEELRQATSQKQAPYGVAYTDQTGQRFQNAANPVTPRAAMVRVNDELVDNAVQSWRVQELLDDVLGHELGHAGMAVAGKEGRGIPGMRFTPEGHRLMQNQIEAGGYIPRNMPEEMAAAALSHQGSSMGQARTELFDADMYSRFMQETFPQLDTPPVFQAFDFSSL